MTRMTINVAVEDDSVEELLAMLISFDRSHPNGLFRIASFVGDMTTDQAKGMFDRLGLSHIYAALTQ